jgi:CMP-N-acetylneuraminic acid synthetase
MNEEVNVFLPMRASSERVPQKNTKRFAGVEGGLCEIKLKQLLASRLISNIFISTDDPAVTEIAQRFNCDKIKIITRPHALALSSTSTDDLIKYVPSVMPEAQILWTHVTSPFIGPELYDEMIKVYLNNTNSYDSLMTVTKVQKFIWNDSGPVNYNSNVEKWPRTQTIKPLWEINSGAFIASKKIYEERMDRIGHNPYLFELNEDVAFDIDWSWDFTTAEALFASGHLSDGNKVI